MNWETGLLGLAAGFLIAVVTAPVGVSGAVFLLPVQLSVLNVPNPAVTPTNLLYNVVATPGALVKYARHGRLWTPLTRLLVLGTLPGVVVGAVLRVFVVPGPTVFRLLVASVLLPLGIWLLVQPRKPAEEGALPGADTAFSDPSPIERRSARWIVAMAVVVGIIGGIYGIGGGSILGPVLVGRGLAVARVAPAALCSTFATSVVGAAAYFALSFTTTGDIAPEWALGLMCGLGGLVGGYVGAHLQPRVPDQALRRLLGALAASLAVLYAVQAFRMVG